MLTSMMPSWRSGGRSWKRPMAPKPALLTRMSTATPSATARSCTWRGACESARSAGQIRTAVPCLSRSVAASFSMASARRATRTRSWPSAANSFASSSPMPAEAPVMRAVSFLLKCPSSSRKSRACAPRSFGGLGHVTRRPAPHVVVEEVRAVAVRRPQDREEAFVHCGVADPLVAVIDVADLGRVETRRRRHAVRHGRAARSIAAIRVRTVPGAAVMKRAAAGPDFHGHQLRREPALSCRLAQFLAIVRGRVELLDRRRYRPLVGAADVLDGAALRRGIVEGDPAGQHVRRIDPTVVAVVLVKAEPLGAR